MHDDRPPNTPPAGGLPPDGITPSGRPQPSPETVNIDPPYGPPPVSSLPEHIQVGPPPLPGHVSPQQRKAPPAPRAPDPVKPGPGEMKDGAREIVETIVFVVVLVLLLKTFVAEAFVIPTGSMATTLLGYHFDVTCEKCHYRFLVNASSEADPQGRAALPVTHCRCPNCRYHMILRRTDLPRQGDQQ